MFHLPKSFFFSNCRYISAALTRSTEVSETAYYLCDKGMNLAFELGI